MSATETVRLVRYQGARARRAATSTAGWPCWAYQQTIRLAHSRPKGTVRWTARGGAVAGLAEPGDLPALFEQDLDCPPGRVAFDQLGGVAPRSVVTRARSKLSGAAGSRTSASSPARPPPRARPHHASAGRLARRTRPPPSSTRSRPAPTRRSSAPRRCPPAAPTRPTGPGPAVPPPGFALTPHDPLPRRRPGSARRVRAPGRGRSQGHARPLTARLNGKLTTRRRQPHHPSSTGSADNSGALATSPRSAPASSLVWIRASQRNYPDLTPDPPARPRHSHRRLYH